MLAGLYARERRHGQGQHVTTSLLGAGMLLQSGVYQRAGVVVSQPSLDRAQTGYGPGYRLYACSDGAWLAVVIPDSAAWERVSRLPECSGLPSRYVPLRRGDDDALARGAEAVLESMFVSAPAVVWRARLQELAVLVEVCEAVDRDQFRRRILDDPFNQQLGRVTSYEALTWGHFEQIGVLTRCGSDTTSARAPSLPDVGQHSVSVLVELGVEQHDIDALLDSKVVRQQG
jgi:crotonobetainyl-CoA:carnitine CoA-transferase CaiB-like acyl-CoA transferase